MNQNSQENMHSVQKEKERIVTQVSESCMNNVTLGQELLDEPGT